MNVSQRRLGATDLEISPIGLGTMQFANRGMVAAWFYAPIPQETATAVVKAALDGGVTWFDTAEMYGGGESERTLTTALRANGVRPGSVLIADKWPPLGRRASHLVRTVGRRLDALQGYPLDLYQVHLAAGSVRRQMSAMADLLAARRISAVGVSNYSAGRMRLAASVLRERGIALAANQVEISLLRRDIESNGVLAAARELGVTLIAYSPLRSGLLTGRFHQNDAVRPRETGLSQDVHRSDEATRSRPTADRSQQTTAWSRQMAARFQRTARSQPTAALRAGRRRLGGFGAGLITRTGPLIGELRAIAAAHGATAGQVALAWLITYYGPTVVAVPGASKPAQAAESAAAMSLRLTDRELARLAELSPA